MLSAEDCPDTEPVMQRQNAPTMFDLAPFDDGENVWERAGGRAEQDAGTAGRQEDVLYFRGDSREDEPAVDNEQEQRPSDASHSGLIPAPPRRAQTGDTARDHLPARPAIRGFQHTRPGGIILPAGESGRCCGGKLGRMVGRRWRAATKPNSDSRFSTMRSEARNYPDPRECLSPLLTTRTYRKRCLGPGGRCHH